MTGRLQNMSWQRRYSVQQRETFILVGGRKQSFMEEMLFEWSQERGVCRKIRIKGHSMRREEYE